MLASQAPHNFDLSVVMNKVVINNVIKIILIPLILFVSLVVYIKIDHYLAS
jgi:hypothetical protein